ncbi:MAG TPA: GNAT family N-acetyltransferase [Levilinea sp.]|nr:GNAT family N-acetyltransferase [Levilinea sp.]
MTITTQQPVILQDLGDGLILRRSVPADADRLAEFNSRIHDDPTVGVWTRDLLLKPHPTFKPDDFTIVEDALTGKIVSSLNLISQTWTYAGVPFGVGRPELVGTDVAYRNRGLVSKQFAVVHEWSQQRGELVQAITGIPYYYRQFGYEMTLGLGGYRSGYDASLPKLKEGQGESYVIRPAEEADLPLVLAMYQRSCDRSLVNARLDEVCWRYELFGKSPDNCIGRHVLVIETGERIAVGILTTPVVLWGDRFVADSFELEAGISWYEPTAAVLRYLHAAGLAMARQKGKSLTHISLALGNEHPAYQVSEQWLPVQRPSYAYYMRVPDLPAFLMHIAPALEQNLHNSLAPGYTGNIKISFYRSGIMIKLEKGRLLEVIPWIPGVGEKITAAFPNHTFLHLVFGYRSLADLRYIYPDCYHEDDGDLILNALFPKRHSNVQVLS